MQAQTGIDIVSIEKELTSLWKQLGDAEGGVIRSCVLNLIVFAEGSKSQPALDEALIDISEKHPNRAIVLLGDRANESASLEAWVTSRCSLSHALSKQVCCEEITVHAAGSSLKESPSAVASLILADLPAYLWIKDSLSLSDPLFKRLAELSNRVLVDSAAPSGPPLAEIASYVQSSARHTPLIDLNWSRIVTWRAVIADCWDIEDHRPHLSSIERVEIKYSGVLKDNPGVAARVFYFSGWLATRLGWKLIERSAHNDQTTRFVFDAGSRRVVLDLRNVPLGTSDGAYIEEITLATSNGLSLTVRRSEDRTRLSSELEFNGQRKSTRVLGYDQWTDAELLSREMEILGRDRVFEKSAALAYTLATLK